MIKLTKFNKEVFYLNSELIELIECIPDTLITMATGKKYYALESAENIIEQVEAYRKKHYSASDMARTIARRDRLDLGDAFDQDEDNV